MNPPPSRENSYRWYILTLAALTNTLVVAVPSQSMTVLFKEISSDLHLSLVQVGLIWGISSLPGIATGLIGGATGDRFGPRRVLIAGCLLAGLSGASRGLSVDFLTLILTMLLMGFFTPFISMNGFKTCGMWFPSRQLGLANGVLSMGMALGFLLGSMFSATVLSPWLGGWRHVLFLFGGMAVLFSIPWYFSRYPQGVSLRPAGVSAPGSLRQTISSVAGIRNLWMLGLAIFGFGGCIQGTLGYLPLYLRGLGWAPAGADGAAAAFHMISMIFVLPVAMASDRLGSRKKVLMVTCLVAALGIGLLSVADGAGVWAAVLMAGMVRDGFMAMLMTAIIETEGVGAAYAGTATGMVMVFGGLGSLVAPPLGNNLAGIAPGLPFVLWSGLALLGFVGLLGTKEKRVEQVLAME